MNKYLNLNNNYLIKKKIYNYIINIFHFQNLLIKRNKNKEKNPEN